MSRLLTQEEIDRQVAELPNWTADVELNAIYEFDDFAGALAFVNKVGEAAEDMNHHPDIDIRWNKVILSVSTHSEDGITQLDIELAHRIAAAV